MAPLIDAIFPLDLDLPSQNWAVVNLNGLSGLGNTRPFVNT